MDWFTQYENDLSKVFFETERQVARFPDPLNEQGLSYFKKFNPLEAESNKNYICYLLPFWLQDFTQLPTQTCRDLSLANVFVMLYYFIQDDLMDEGLTSEYKKQLALANCLYIEFIEIYHQYFPSSSSFWTFYKKYTRDWANCVINEDKADYFQTNKPMIAQKAAPLKLASTGSLLLSNQSAHISEVSEIIDHTLLTLQMTDDWVDWEEDLIENNYNCLLSMVKKNNQCDHDDVLTAEKVKDAIYTRGILVPYSTISQQTYQKMVGNSVHFSHLTNFYGSLVSELQQGAQKIEEDRKTLALGGLYYFMSQRANNSELNMEI